MADDWRHHPDLPARGTVLCRLEEIPDGGGRVLAFGEGPKPLRILLLRSGARVNGWHNRCPHFGMPLAVKDEWLIVAPHESLKCNVHYARFRWADGVCDDGECLGEQLDAIAVEVVNDEVRLGAISPTGD